MKQKGILFLVMYIVCVSALKADYTNGVYILNEDWFGHNESSMNFYDYENGDIIYNVFSNAGDGQYLGGTSQFAQIYGDKIYIISKQSYGEDTSTGGRLIVADAKTLEQEASLLELDGKDGRSYVGISDKKGYVGTSCGVYVYDVENKELGAMIDGTGTDSGDVYSEQIGDMLRYRDGKVYVAAQGVGVYVIDTGNDELEATIELPDVVTIFVTADGTLYAAENNCSSWSIPTDAVSNFVKINTETLETTIIEMPAGMSVQNQWGSWRAGSVACDISENSIYFVNSNSAYVVSKYNFDTNELVEEFVKLPYGNGGNQIVYGTGVGVDPVTGQLLVTATEEGWTTHYQNNWIHFINTSTGEIEKTIELEQHYWFMAMPVYPDVAYPVINVDSDYSVKTENEEKLFNLRKSVTDKDNNDNLIISSVKSLDATICDVAVDTDGNVTVKGLAEGTTELLVTADSNGHITTKNIKISVLLATALDAVKYEIVQPIEYYTLQGMKVAPESLGKGLYIKKQGSKTRKVYIERVD